MGYSVVRKVRVTATIAERRLSVNGKGARQISQLDSVVNPWIKESIANYR